MGLGPTDQGWKEVLAANGDAKKIYGTVVREIKNYDPALESLAEEALRIMYDPYVNITSPYHWGDFCSGGFCLDRTSKGVGIVYGRAKKDVDTFYVTVARISLKNGVTSPSYEIKTLEIPKHYKPYDALRAWENS